MKVLGKNGSEWLLDEGLRTIARELVNEFTEEVGHVDLQRVVFVRVSDPNAKWLGKCWYINTPHCLLTWYAYSALKRTQLLVDDFEVDNARANLLDDLMTVNYIIALNDAQFERFKAGEPGLLEKQVRYTVLHELMHVRGEMDGIRKHDVEDFSDLLRKLGLDWTSGVYDDEEVTES